MNKKVYQTPQTEMVRVLTEGTFAASVVDNTTSDKIQTTGHAIDEYTDSTGSSWNNGEWQ
ncbi:MAG: hypothetical protein Q4A18_03175 [Rikenellaceae bacterium]|nr:hypothetical protein [Rikenellaceae bacterium]